VRGPRRAAIAYLGEDAPALLPLRAGDLLVVNASRAAVRAHVTSPIALAHYVEAGVRVLSSPNLHANVIATNRRAIIGSANASHSSTIADEAVVVTDDPEVVAAAWTLIDGIDEITEVDHVSRTGFPAGWAPCVRRVRAPVARRRRSADAFGFGRGAGPGWPETGVPALLTSMSIPCRVAISARTASTSVDEEVSSSRDSACRLCF
jgi:hypothetical protein